MRVVKITTLPKDSTIIKNRIDNCMVTTPIEIKEMLKNSLNEWESIRDICLKYKNSTYGVISQLKKIKSFNEIEMKSTEKDYVSIFVYSCLCI